MLIKYLIFCCLGLLFLVEQRSAFVINVKSRNCSDNVSNNNNSSKHLSFLLLGATGDLARREVYPALWNLYRDNKLPKDTLIHGYSRSSRTIDYIRQRVKPYITVKPEDQQLFEEFWGINSYINGTKNQTEDYERIGRLLEKEESLNGGNRIFYCALPPATYNETAHNIKNGAMAKNGWTRLVFEKPFGRDSESAEELSQQLASLFEEEQIYRTDHFLGYEMVQNLVTLRFANRLFQSSWNKDNIAAIKIDFKENFGIEGRGSYFDENGMIRDVVENHLLQIMSLIAMEEPKSLDSNEVRNAKVDLLKKVKEVELKDVVVGQYVGNPDSKDPRERTGYLEEPTVTNKNSTTETFSLTVLKVDNERWQGVPFIIRAGKGLKVNKTEVIIQFKEVNNNLFVNQTKRNELVIRIGKTEALQAKIMSKTPGITSHIEEINFDFDYVKEYKNMTNPTAYERLILNLISGTQINFVREDELREGWRIFTKILHELEEKKIKPVNYIFGLTEPKEADDMERKYNFL